MVANKKRICALGVIATVLLMAFILHAIPTTASAATFPSEGKSVLDIVNGNLSNELPDGDAKILLDDGIFEDIFQQSLVSVETNNYVYLFDNTSLEPVGILLMGDYDASANWTNTVDTAIDHAERLVYTFCPEFPKEDVKITCSQYGENKNGLYSIEFIEILNGNFYGKKISVVLTTAGTIESLICANMDANEKIMASNDNYINEKEAIDIAYAAASSTALELEKSEYSDASVEKTGNDVIITDSGVVAETVLESKPYEIYVSETDNQKVSAQLEINNNTTEWVVTIENIPTNMVWSMGFKIHVDATTGDVLQVYHTR